MEGEQPFARCALLVGIILGRVYHGQAGFASRGRASEQRHRLFDSKHPSRLCDPCTRARPGVVQPPATRWTTPACHVHPRADRTAWWCRPRGVQWPGASVGIPVRPPSSRHTRSHHPTPHAINVPRCHEAWVGRIDWWGGGTARRVTTPARRRWSTRRCGVENPNPNCGTGSRGRASTIKHSYGSGIRPSMRPEASPRRSDLSTTFRCVP
jgi:hypothetical protein